MGKADVPGFAVSPYEEFQLSRLRHQTARMCSATLAQGEGRVEDACCQMDWPVVQVEEGQLRAAGGGAGPVEQRHTRPRHGGDTHSPDRAALPWAVRLPSGIGCAGSETHTFKPVVCWPLGRPPTARPGSRLFQTMGTAWRLKQPHHQKALCHLQPQQHLPGARRGGQWGQQRRAKSSGGRPCGKASGRVGEWALAELQASCCSAGLAIHTPRAAVG